MLQSPNLGLLETETHTEKLARILYRFTHVDCPYDLDKPDGGIHIEYLDDFVRSDFLDKADRLLGLLGDFENAARFVLNLRSVNPRILVSMIEEL